MSNPALDNRTPSDIAYAMRIRQLEFLARLRAMCNSRTPVRNIPENRHPTAPIKDNGGRVAVFQSGYIETPVSRVLFN